MIRNLLIGLLTLVVPAVAAALADDPPATQSARAFAELKASYQKDMKEFQEANRREAEARVAEAQKAAAEAAAKGSTLRLAIPAARMISAASGPGGAYSPRFLEFATSHAKAPEALEALSLAYNTSDRTRGAEGTHAGVMKALETQFATHPEVGGFVRRLRSDAEPATVAAVRAVLEKHPDVKVQAVACKTLVSMFDTQASQGKTIAQSEAARKNFEKSLGNKRVDEMVQGFAEAERQAKEYQALLATKYAHVLADLSIGSPAPELVSRDLEGKTVRLSDLKGHVVVLDIWATWCGPCKAMIPHERAMVERLKDKPFTLVSISADEELKTLTDFLAQEAMPWKHWWNGATGGIVEAWDVQYYPTIYVLDAQGVIRFKDVREKALEAAVDSLLAEAGSRE